MANQLSTAGFSSPSKIRRVKYPPSKTKPWPHQEAAYAEVVTHDDRMLYMKMATGKSKPIIDYLVTQKGKLSLILAPLYVVEHVWPLEFSTHNKHSGLVLFLYKGSSERKAQLVVDALNQQGDTSLSLTIVTNYEAARSGSLKEVLLRQNWDNVILDESHRIKGATSALNRFCTRLGKRAKKRICLTGTLTPHSPLDVFGQFKFLAPEVLGLNWGDFKQEYAEFGLWGEIVGYKNLKRLAKKISPHVFYCDHSVFDSVTKKLPDRLPPSVFECVLPKNLEHMYRSMEREFVADTGTMRVVAEHTLERVVRMQQMVSGFLPVNGVDKQLESPKKKLLGNVLDDLMGEPVVVFGRFDNDIRIVQDVCRKLKLKCSVLTGKEDTLRDWQQEKTDVIAVQVKCGDVGLNLSRSRTPIFYGLPKSPGDYDQCLHRFIRTTSKHPDVRPIHLVVQNTIDEVAYKALLDREDLIAAFTKKLTGRK